MNLATTWKRHKLITHCNFIICKPNKCSTLDPSGCSNSSHCTRAILEMRSTIAILNTSRSGLGKSLTLVCYSSVLPKNVKYRQFKSKSRSSSQWSYNPWSIPVIQCLLCVRYQLFKEVVFVLECSKLLSYKISQWNWFEICEKIRVLLWLITKHNKCRI